MKSATSVLLVVAVFCLGVFVARQLVAEPAEEAQPGRLAVADARPLDGVAETERERSRAAVDRSVAAGQPASGTFPVRTVANVAAAKGGGGDVTRWWNQWGGSRVRNNTPKAKNIPIEWSIGEFDEKTGEWNKEHRQEHQVGRHSSARRRTAIRSSPTARSTSAPTTAPAT